MMILQSKISEKPWLKKVVSDLLEIAPSIHNSDNFNEDRLARKPPFYPSKYSDFYFHHNYIHRRVEIITQLCEIINYAIQEHQKYRIHRLLKHAQKQLK
jgi:hypothetical protein